MSLVLASNSATRRQMLEKAGVSFDVMTSNVDEEQAKLSLRADGLDARDLADALAELKAVRVSARLPGALVLGCDSTVALEDGTMIDKVPDRPALAAQLAAMSGTPHSLYSAAVIVENGQPVWRHVDRAKLWVRTLTPAFIDAYLDREGDALFGCVGGYRVEGLGAQLFSRIEGSHYTILGLPLLPLLDYLRTRGVLAR